MKLYHGTSVGWLRKSHFQYGDSAAQTTFARGELSEFVDFIYLSKSRRGAEHAAYRATNLNNARLAKDPNFIAAFNYAGSTYQPAAWLYTVEISPHAVIFDKENPDLAPGERRKVLRTLRSYHRRNSDVIEYGLRRIALSLIGLRSRMTRASEEASAQRRNRYILKWIEYAVKLDDAEQRKLGSRPRNRGPFGPLAVFCKCAGFDLIAAIHWGEHYEVTYALLRNDLASIIHSELL